MKKTILLAFLAAAGGLSAAIMDGIAAKVDNDVITIGDVLAEVRRNPIARENFNQAARDRTRLEALYREAVEALVDRRLILSEAAAKKMEMQEWVIDNRVREIVHENFKGDRNILEAELRKSGVPFDEWRNTIREDLILGGMRYQTIDKYVHVSPAAMRKEYEMNRARYHQNAAMDVRVILLKPADDQAPSVAERAKAILDELAGGADFAALARRHSADTHAADGGLWKNVDPEEDFREEIADTLAHLSVGEHSELVNLDGWGFIVKKEKETPARDLSFAEAYNAIAAHVRREEASRAYAAWMKRLRAAAFVKIYPMPEK